MAFSLTAATVYADGPSSGPKEPSKPEIRRLLKQYEDGIAALTQMTGAVAAKGTLDELNSVSAGQGDVGIVFTGDDSGVYKYVSGTWVKQSELPSDVAQIAADVASAQATIAQSASSAAVTAAQQAKTIRDGLDELDLTINMDPVDAGKLFNRIVDVVSITDFGGMDNGSTDNVPAWNAAKAAVAAGGTVRFPRVAGGRYYFNGLPDFATAGLVLDVDQGVEFSVTGIPTAQVKLARDLPLYIPAQQYTYSMFARDRQKKTFLTPSDIDRSVTSNVDLSTLIHASLDYTGNADTWAAATPTINANDVQWSIANDGKFYGSFLPAVPGDEISVGFPDDTNFFRAAIIRGTGGNQIVWIQQDGTAAIASKATGAAWSVSTFSWTGKDTLQTYGRKAIMTIRVLNQNTWALLINGMMVATVGSLGFIELVGFGVFGAVVGPTVIKVLGWIKRTGGIYGGTSFLTIGGIGDSITAPQHGNWLSHARDALDGSFGIRVTAIENRAVGGDTVYAQWSRLNTAGPGTAAVWYVQILTNDIQGLTNIDDDMNYLDAIFTILINAGRKVIFGIPPLFYGQAQNGGKGQDAINYGAGSPYRLRALRLCASRGIRVVDTLQLLGQIAPSGLPADQFEDAFPDNIHPGGRTNQIYGRAIAGAMLAELCPRPTKAIVLQQLYASLGTGGWTFASAGDLPRMSRTEEGRVSLNGILNAGTTTVGTVVMTLPVFLRPRAIMKLSVATSAATPAVIEVRTNGQIAIVSWPAGATWLSLDSLSWQT